MEITVTNQEGVELAKGKLEVDTSASPNTANFTPDGGTKTACTGVVWTSTPNGAVRFTFTVGASGNGDFPQGPGSTYAYNFKGTQQANGKPKGNVKWPNPVPGPEGEFDEDVTWQAGSTGEPFAATKGAS